MTGLSFFSKSLDILPTEPSKKIPPKAALSAKTLGKMKTFIVELWFYDWNDEHVVTHVLEIVSFTIPSMRVVDYCTRIMDAYPSCKEVMFVWKTK